MLAEQVIDLVAVLGDSVHESRGVLVDLLDSPARTSASSSVSPSRSC